MKIITRGTVVKLPTQLVVVMLERASSYGWNCLCISAHPTSPYYRQDIFVFEEDLKEGTIVEYLE